MSKLTKARWELREMDALAAGNSPIHTLHPVAKLLTTIFYIYTVVSFPKYDLSGLTVMVLYPVIFYQAAGIRVSDCCYRLRFAGRKEKSAGYLAENRLCFAGFGQSDVHAYRL